MYFYFFGFLDADLLGGVSGLSLNKAMKSKRGMLIAIASANTKSLISCAVGYSLRISPGNEAPKVIETRLDKTARNMTLGTT
jgi:hypothetical protein